MLQTNVSGGLSRKQHPYFAGDAHAKATGLLRILGEDGVVDDDLVSEIDVELARRMYHGMLTIRIVDERMMTLQRQGRISFYGEGRGQEASTVGSAAAMRRDDWLVPALREAGAGLYRGMPLSSYVAQIFATSGDSTKGRQMPCHPCDRATNYVNMSSVVATQIPHAVGIAWAMKLSGDTGRACVGYMGDGATSEGDFHCALNFAGVSKVPVVLICQNNQWAISTSTARQTAAETYALKGLGYGIESLRVDGNDIFATYTATKYALDKARRGDGPTFLELLTYRVGAHTSSDDPSQYRDESVTEVWKTQRDPIARLRSFLLARHWLNNADHDRMASEIEAEVRAVVAAQEQLDPPPVDTIIEDVFETPSWSLQEQLEALEGG